MQSAWIFKLQGFFVFALVAALCSNCCCQDNKGSEDLDKAFDQKIKSQSTKDLDEVVKLCKSAIEKGLDEEAKTQAKQLAASTLYEHADQLGQRIFASRGQDRRWRMLRSQALNRLEEAVEFQPEMAEAYLMMSRLNTLPGGDEDKAKETIEKAIQLAGEDREQLSNALFMRASLSQDEEAQLSDLNQAIKINPENHDAVRVRGAYYLSHDKPEEAIKDINQWLESGEENTNNYVVVVQSLMSMGTKFDAGLQAEAKKIIDKAIANDPENASLHVVRAQINVIQEQLDEAVADVDRALKIDRKNIGALLLRATVYSEQQKLDEALADVNDVLEQEPLLVQGIQMRGMILSQQEKFTEAIADIKMLAEHDATNQFLQRQLAMLYNADDQPKEAIRIYDELLELNSKEQSEGLANDKKIVYLSRSLASLRGRGDARLSTGEHKEAVKDYEDALKLAEEIKKLEEAEEVPEPTKPDDGILNNLAWVLATSPFDEVRNGKAAIEYATQAAELTEFKQAHILSTLASGYAESGDFESAIKWIEKAIEVNKVEGEEQASKRNSDQKESLQKEHLSYQEKKPWRELQNVEKDRLEKAELEKTPQEKEIDELKKMDSDPQAEGTDDKKSDDKKDKQAEKKEADKPEKAEGGQPESGEKEGGGQ